MTRKDYKLIASIIKDSIIIDKDGDSYIPTDTLVSALRDAYSLDNPRFKPVTFTLACKGGQE